MKTDQQKRTGGSPVMRVLAAVLLVVLGAAIVVGILVDQVSRTTARTKSEDNIRTLLWITTRRKSAIPGNHLEHTGRNFILTTVASGGIDAHRRSGIRVLWPPNSGRAGEVELQAYQEVTWKRLASSRFPHLTGYAGPRVAPGSDRSEKVDGWGTPLIADLTQPEGIVVGFLESGVAFLTWEELGMERPDGPVVVGLEATHPLLRALSNE